MTDRAQRNTERFFLGSPARISHWLLVAALAGCGKPTEPPASPEATAAAPRTETDSASSDSRQLDSRQPEPAVPGPNADPQRPFTGVAKALQSQPMLESNVLFNTLASPDTSPGDWEKAQSRLMELGATAIPTLVRELKSDRTDHREVAASALAMLGPESAEAAPALKQALDDDSIYVRANAATALCAIPEQEEIVIPALAKLLICDDPQVRQMAAVNLSNFGTEAAPYVQEFTAALEQAPDDVLVSLVDLLGRIGPQAESAAPQLQQIAFEQSGDAQQAAQAALERISEQPADE